MPHMPSSVAAPATCLGIACTYVLGLYLFGAGPRQLPRIVKRRMASVGAAACLSWLPLAWVLKEAPQSQHDLLPLLGVRLPSLAPAALLPLLLAATLYLGPLLYLSICQHARCQHTLWQPKTIHTARDVLVAPLAEEWVFRACMVPLLWLQGWSHARVVLITPLFFSAAHLHHLRELLVVQRMAPQRALAMVALQWTYTTLFGWFATHVFLSTGHLAAAVLVHAFCNVMGLPPFAAMAKHPRARLLGTATGAGIVLFAVLLPRVLVPGLYANIVYV